MPQQRLFVSDAFAVLQDAFVTAVQTLKTADPLAPLTVLVPNDLLAQHLSRVVARAGHGHPGLHIFTLTDFARAITERTLVQEGQKPLSPSAALWIVKKLLRGTESNNYFAPLAPQPRFPRDLLATITDLKQAEMQPYDVHRFAEEAHLRGTYRHKIDSLHVLYERYARFLTEQHLYDEADLLEHAAVWLEANSGTTPIILYGFADLTPLQRRLIAVTLRGRDVLAFFPWHAGAAYEHATSTLAWLTGLGLQSTPLFARDKPQNDLARVQARLFEGGALRPSYGRDGSVTLISAPNESREAREIGRAILELVREQDLRFDEIAVLLRDPATNGPLMAETLTGVGIPCFLSNGIPLSRTQAGQNLLLLCQVLAEDYARPRVLEFLKVANPPFTALLGELAMFARPAHWEALSLEAGVVRGAEQWRERLSRVAAERQQSTPDDRGDADTEDLPVLHAFLIFMQGLLAASESIPRVNTWQGWAEQIVPLVRTYISPTAHTAQIEEELARLGQLDVLGEHISIGEWYRDMAAALATATVTPDACDRTGVFIGDLQDACGVQFRAVLIAGLVEGAFPRTLRQDPLLLDSERQHMGEVVLCDLPQRSHLDEAERLWFTLATQGAADRLVLTYSRFDQVGGHAQVPSFYLLRVIEALSGQSASFADLDAWAVRVPLTPFYAGPASKAIDALEFHLASVEQALAEGSPTPLAYLPTVAPFFSHALHTMQQRWDAPSLTACDGMIEDEMVKAVLQQRLFPAGTVLSASALESYARCPFHYFLNTVLGLTPREEPEQMLTVRPRDRGALLHDILHDFFVRLRQQGRLPLACQDRAALGLLLTQVAEEHFQIFARTKATGFRLLWELEQERIHERLALLLAQACDAGGDFLPVTFEAHFGTGIPDEQETFFPVAPVRFLLEDGEEIGLRGRIDRIDLSADQQRARVLDYKTGKPIRGHFAGGTALQLPLYVFAARVLRPDLTWMSAEYVYVDHLSRGRSLRCTPDTWPGSLTTLRQIVTALVQGMRAGWFFPAPEACHPCPFSVICGTQVEARTACKQNDPRGELLRRVRTIA